MKPTPLQISKVCSNLVGTPYSELNCWGVVRLFYKEVFNIELKNYYDNPILDVHKAGKLIYTNKGDFVEVTPDRISTGDILLLKLTGIPSHIAVCIGGNRMLHTTAGAGCVVEKISSTWRKNIDGVYRVKCND